LAFQNLDLKFATCFGWRPSIKGAPERGQWCDLAREAKTKGWRHVDVHGLDRDLATNVDASYFYLARGKFVDLDTQFAWRAVFVNDHGLWRMDIPGSPEAETLPEDAKAFFESEFFKKFSKRCGDLVDDAKRLFREVVEPHVKDGDLLSVAEEKLERILFLAENAHTMDNLRQGKYELV
jgi:hypothetical protein